jgi:hypothetical protein
MGIRNWVIGEREMSNQAMSDQGTSNQASGNRGKFLA